MCVDSIKWHWGPMMETFAGGCGSGPHQSCISEVHEKFGASSLPKNCECIPAGAQHICSCDIVYRS
ncbi:hypothetical protein LINGRAHAP2_LOCUS36571 [Linum grandiflorum]